MSAFDKGLLVLTALDAANKGWERIEGGMDPSEALFRSSVDFAVDLAVTGTPITLAAEIASQILFKAYGTATGESDLGEGVLSSTLQRVAQAAIDKIAAAAAAAGDAEIAFEEILGRATEDELLRRLDAQRVLLGIECAEDQLNALAPGDPKEWRLLRIRAALKRLSRAQGATRPTW